MSALPVGSHFLTPARCESVADAPFIGDWRTQLRLASLCGGALDLSCLVFTLVLQILLSLDRVLFDLLRLQQQVF